MSLFKKNISELGAFSLRSYSNTRDVEVVHRWVNLEYAKYWMLQNTSVEEVSEAYADILASGNTQVYMGSFNNEPAFLLEFYNAEYDNIAKYYPAQKGDYGIHILVAPAEKRVPNFTWHVFKTIIEFVFSHKYVERIVVEPDTNNIKIHALNLKAGFSYQGIINMPEKRASLAFCTRDDFRIALNKN